MSYIGKYVKFLQKIPEHDTRYYAFMSAMHHVNSPVLFDDALAILIGENSPWPKIKTSTSDRDNINEDVQQLVQLCKQRKQIIDDNRRLLNYNFHKDNPPNADTLANLMQNFLRDFPDLKSGKYAKRKQAEDAWRNMGLPLNEPLNEASYEFIYAQHYSNARQIAAEILSNGGEDNYKNRHKLLIENYDRILLSDDVFFTTIPKITKMAALNYTMRTLTTAYGPKQPTWLKNLDTAVNTYRAEYESQTISLRTEQQLTDAINAAHKAKKPYLISRILVNFFFIVGTLGIGTIGLIKRYMDRKEIGFYKENDISRAIKNLKVDLDKVWKVENPTLLLADEHGDAQLQQPAQNRSQRPGGG